MSEIAGHAVPRGTANAVVHESYSFACMRCGHGWEQSYEIEHHTDADGQEFVMYVAGGQVVPSPLSKPTCQNCGSHVLRIMRPGRVSSVLDAVRRHEHHHTPQAGPVEVRQPETAGGEGSAGADGSKGGEDGEGSEAGERAHHWHLSDLLHVFQHKAG